MQQPLWFIAILPPEAVAQKIKDIQQEIADRFDPKRILKMPAHITVEPPFRYEDTGARHLEERLAPFFSEREAFGLQLRNFGTFRQDVVFIEVAPSLPLLELHAQLSDFLRVQTGIVKHEPWHGGYTPHVTVANRDVTPQAHERIWREFNTRKFYAEFQVSEIALLRHDEKIWHVQRRFPLK